MTFNRNAGNHRFTDLGGKCVKCGMTWNAYDDKDSRDYRRSCPGGKQEALKPMRIDGE